MVIFHPDNLIFSNDGSLKLTGFGYVQGKVSLKSDAYAAAEMFEHSSQSVCQQMFMLCVQVYTDVLQVRLHRRAYRRMSQDMLQKPSALGVEIPTSTESALMMGMKLSAKERFQANEGFCKEPWSGTGCHT